MFFFLGAPKELNRCNDAMNVDVDVYNLTGVDVDNAMEIDAANAMDVGV